MLKLRGGIPASYVSLTDGIRFIQGRGACSRSAQSHAAQLQGRKK